MDVLRTVYFLSLDSIVQTKHQLYQTLSVQQTVQTESEQAQKRAMTVTKLLTMAVPITA